MLLIVGGESDPNTQRVVDQAHIRGIDYLFWNTDAEQSLDIAWDFASPDLDLGARRVLPQALFNRWNVFGGDSERNLAAYETAQAYALAWPQVRVLNRHTSTDINHKALNLRWAREAGFAIPETLVMANLWPLQTLPEAERRIAKPLGGGTHTRDTRDLAADEEALANSKPQFVQNRLDGANLRVFSIGGSLFGFHLATSELDYRDDAAVEVLPHEVPAELVEPTRQLVERKQFDYCALDFRCHDGFQEPVFLEINSFPMFVRFDDVAENGLADAILDFLMGA